MNYRTSFSIPKDPKNFIRDAILLHDKILLDELDCSKSMCRVATSKSLEWIVSGCLQDPTTHWVMIYRDMAQFGQKDYWDCGGSFIKDGISYFLWVILSPKNGSRLVDVYNLKAR